MKKGYFSIALGILFIITPFLNADQIGISSFKYLNSNENAAIIDDSEAQDILNVDITAGGKSVKKRQGYGLYKDLGTDQGIHGGHHFFDSTGNDVTIWGSSTSLYGIVSDGTPTQLLSSSTINSTWDCADTQGQAYCVNSSRDALIKTAGTNMTWYSTPLGTMVEVTPDRLVISGVAASPNTLFVSGSNDFTNFTTGANTTDPFTEVIAAPGSHITHTRWGCGKLLWWKEKSFGYFDFDDQFSGSVKIVSDNIGTFDNTSAIDPGGNVWFRGQDSHVWKYDCSSIEKKTIEITPNVQNAARRTGNSWAQTSQSDFEAGFESPAHGLSTNLLAGSVSVSTFTISADTNTWNVQNNGFETCPSNLPTYWTRSGSNIYCATSYSASATTCGVALGPKTGSKMAQINLSAPFTWSIKLLRASDSSELYSLTQSGTPAVSCSWSPLILPAQSYLGVIGKIKLTSSDGTTLISNPFIIGNDIYLYTRIIRGSPGGEYFVLMDDFLNGYNSFTSSATTVSISSGILQSQFTSTTTATTPIVIVQKSSTSEGPWTNLTTSSSTNANFSTNYFRYISSFTRSASDTALTNLSTLNVVMRSTGTYYSVVHNATGLTAWGVLNVNETLPGNSSVAYFVRSSTGSFSEADVAPTWVSQIKNNNITASTGTYFQLRGDFTITSATEPLSLDDFTFNWFEGTAADQTYAIYFDNGIWFSIAYGVGQSTNNYIFKHDLINDGWTLYNFGAGGLLVQNNYLFFGQVHDSNLFRYGNNVKADNGTSISAYWKSKDFTGADPFLENSLMNIDTFLKRDAGQSITVSYALNSSTTTTSYSINLSSTTDSVIRHKKLLPSGKIGGTFNIQYGDSSAFSTWELLGARIGYSQLPYRPSQ